MVTSFVWVQSIINPTPVTVALIRIINGDREEHSGKERRTFKGTCHALDDRQKERRFATLLVCVLRLLGKVAVGGTL